MNPMIINPGTPAPSKMDRLAEQASAASARIRPAQLMQKSQGISAPGTQAMQAAGAAAIGDTLGEPGKIRAENRAHGRVLEMGEMGHQRDKEMADVAHQRKISRDDEVDRREWERTGRETHELRKEESKQRSATSKGQMDMYAQNAKLARENHSNTILLNIQKLRDAKRSGNIEAAKGKAADEILAHIDPLVKTGAADLHSRVHTLYVTEAQDGGEAEETLEAAIVALNLGEDYASDPASVQQVGQWLVSNGTSLMANNLVERWDERLKDLLEQKTDILKMKGMTKEQSMQQDGELDSIIARMAESIGYDPQIEPSVRSLPTRPDDGGTGTGTGEEDSAFATWSVINPKLEGESDAAYFNRYKMSLGGGEAPSDEGKPLGFNSESGIGKPVFTGDAKSLTMGAVTGAVNLGKDALDAIEGGGGAGAVASHIGGKAKKLAMENPGEVAAGAVVATAAYKAIAGAQTFDDLLKANTDHLRDFSKKMNARIDLLNKSGGGIQKFNTAFPTPQDAKMNYGTDAKGNKLNAVQAAKQWNLDMKAHYRKELGNYKFRRIKTLFSKFPKLSKHLSNAANKVAPKGGKVRGGLKLAGGAYGVYEIINILQDAASIAGLSDEEKQAIQEAHKVSKEVDDIIKEGEAERQKVAQATKDRANQLKAQPDANATDNNATAPVDNNATHTMPDGSVMQGATHTPGAAIIAPDNNSTAPAGKINGQPVGKKALTDFFK